MKKLTIRNKKPLSFSAKIKQIESSIQENYATLEKVYPKILASVEKEFNRASKALKKALSLKPVKKAARKIGKKTTVKTDALEKAVQFLKAEKAEVLASFNKFKAGKQVWKKFEKSWSKKAKKTKGIGRKTRAKRAKISSGSLASLDSLD